MDKIEQETMEVRIAPADIAKQSRVFYGWVVVACAFVILCVAYGIQFSFGVFMPEISRDTGWGRDALSLPYSLYVFVYSALGVVSGRFTDRWGPRIVITIGGCLLGIGIIFDQSGHGLMAYVCVPRSDRSFRNECCLCSL